MSHQGTIAGKASLPVATGARSIRRRLLWILLLCFPILGILSSANASTPPGTWNLVWDDEFASDANIDTNLWGFGSTPWGAEAHDTCSLIMPENTYLSDGTLINSSKLGLFIGPSGRTYSYSSGWLWSKTWLTYGYLEIRAQYLNNRGAWPAFWSLMDG